MAEAPANGYMLTSRKGQKTNSGLSRAKLKAEISRERETMSTAQLQKQFLIGTIIFFVSFCASLGAQTRPIAILGGNAANLLRIGL